MITEIISYDSHTFAPDYEVGFVTASEPRLAPSSVQLLERIGAWPVIVALQRKPQRIALIIRIVGANRDALRSQLFRWFDPEDETPKVLVAENHDGVQMYVNALCEELHVYGDQQHDTAFVATLVVDGDVRWRSVSENSETWSITASGQTHVFTNDGEDEAYPVIKVKPTSNRTGGYAYRRWVPVVWRSSNAGAQYPVRAELDTATLVSGGKMQADGDDLRISVDGAEVYRWLDDMNSGATGIWFNMDFSSAPSLTLKTAIPGSGDIASIEFNESDELDKLPESGILLIGNEAFVYTAKDTTSVAVTGITRAAKGTSAAAHNAGDAVYWIQHDVWILYGNAGASAPTVDDDYKPAFELDQSTNTLWHYEIFGDSSNKRAARWQGWGSITTTGAGGRYTGTQLTLDDPYSVAGAWLSSSQPNAFGWYLENPCGIVNAAWSNGQKYAISETSNLACLLRYWVRGASWWSSQATLSAPSAADTWEAWSESAAASDWDAADTLAIVLYFKPSRVEVGTVEVHLNASEVPTVSVGGEQGNYSLGCTITNETTGDAITLDFVIDLDSELEIDTDQRTVTWLADDSGQFQALSLSSARRHWLRLLPGSNTLRFDDTGTVTVTLSWEERYY